jgi:hypothetical protein
MLDMTKLMQASLCWNIVRNSFKIALVVGTLLNLINQGESLLHGDKISWFHFLLNYLVPYCVASYSAAKNEIGPRGINDERSRSAE